MDKYVTRTPRVKSSNDLLVRTPSSKGEEVNTSKQDGAISQQTKAKNTVTEKRQATLESLQRVIIVDDILRMKSVLLLDNQSCDVLLEALKELGKKIPSKDILLSTKIGHVVNKLRKHSSPEVAKEARQVVTCWRTFHKEKSQLTPIEVRTDTDTENFRRTARKLLASSLELEECHVLPEAIEREAFHQQGKRVHHVYRRHIRKLVFTLKHQSSYGVRLKSGDLSVKDFVDHFKKCS